MAICMPAPGLKYLLATMPSVMAIAMKRSFSKREMYFDCLAGLGSVLTRLNNQENIPDYSYVINSTIIRLWISKEGLMEAVRLSENINWIKEIESTQQSTFFANPKAKEKIINYKP